MSEFLTARLDLSTRCNLRCVHCCAAGQDDSAATRLSLTQALALLDVLVRNGVAHVNVLGQEPFLYPGIASFLEQARAHGLQVSLTTNGTVANPDTLSRVAQLDLAALFFSLDGPTSAVNDPIRGKGVFEAVSRAIQTFIACRAQAGASTKVTINTVLTRSNADTIPQMIDLCASMGVDAFNLLRLEPLGRAVSSYSRIRLTATEQFDVAERTFTAVRSHGALAATILSVNPLYLEYFHKKCGVQSPIRTSGCKACRSEIYVDAQGVLSPCLATSPAFVERLRAPYPSFSSQPSEYTRQPFESLPMFRAFQDRFPLTRRLYAGLSPCDRCPYLATVCYPCPLGGGQDAEPLCAVAYSRGVDHGFWT